jgi:hypothetical protein
MDEPVCEKRIFGVQFRKLATLLKPGCPVTARHKLNISRRMRALLGVTVLVSQAGARDIPERCIEVSRHIDALIDSGRQVFEAYSVDDPASLGEVIPSRPGIFSEIQGCTDDVVTRRLLHAGVAFARQWRFLPDLLTLVRTNAPSESRSDD